MTWITSTTSFAGRCVCFSCRLARGCYAWRGEGRGGCDAHVCVAPLFLCHRRYLCPACTKGNEGKERPFTSTTPKALATLPQSVRDQFPCILTKRAGLDARLVALIPALIDAKSGPAAISRLLLEMATLRHSKAMLQYYTVIEERLIEERHAARHPATAAMFPGAWLSKLPDPCPLFSLWADQGGYRGAHPSGRNGPGEGEALSCPGRSWRWLTPPTSCHLIQHWPRLRQASTLAASTSR